MDKRHFMALRRLSCGVRWHGRGLRECFLFHRGRLGGRLRWRFGGRGMGGKLCIRSRLCIGSPLRGSGQRRNFCFGGACAGLCGLQFTRGFCQGGDGGLRGLAFASGFYLGGSGAGLRCRQFARCFCLRGSGNGAGLNGLQFAFGLCLDGRGAGLCSLQYACNLGFSGSGAGLGGLQLPGGFCLAGGCAGLCGLQLTRSFCFDSDRAGYRRIEFACSLRLRSRWRGYFAWRGGFGLHGRNCGSWHGDCNRDFDIVSHRHGSLVWVDAGTRICALALLPVGPLDGCRSRACQTAVSSHSCIRMKAGRAGFAALAACGKKKRPAHP